MVSEAAYGAVASVASVGRLVSCSRLHASSGHTLLIFRIPDFSDHFLEEEGRIKIKIKLSEQRCAKYAMSVIFLFPITFLQSFNNYLDYPANMYSTLLIDYNYNVLFVKLPNHMSIYIYFSEH